MHRKLHDRVERSKRLVVRDVLLRLLRDEQGQAQRCVSGIDRFLKFQAGPHRSAELRDSERERCRRAAEIRRLFGKRIEVIGRRRLDGAQNIDAVEYLYAIRLALLVERNFGKLPSRSAETRAPDPRKRDVARTRVAAAP